MALRALHDSGISHAAVPIPTLFGRGKLMAVYVDDMQAGFGRMKMCHMIADNTEELLAMVDKIGVQRKWIQDPGTSKKHFDIWLSKRAKALAAGAVAITRRDFVIAVGKRRPVPVGALSGGDE